MGKLTALEVRNENTPGRHPDGDGLYLLVSDTGSKSWVLRFQRRGRRRDIGLGSVKSVSLKLARERAATTRAQIEMGIDPVKERLREQGVPLFSEAALTVWQEQAPAWKNKKHAAQWLSSLETHAFPSIGDVPVDQLDAGQVRDVLASIWLTHHETARRVRQRIGGIIDWSVAKGYRDAPLAMSVVNAGLPKMAKRERHHPAIAYARIPWFAAELQAMPQTFSTLALRFQLLTAARSGEVRQADWSQIDKIENVWRLTAEQMKVPRAHNVPLSKQALAVLDEAAALTGKRSGLIFPGMKKGKPLSDMTLGKVMKRIVPAEEGVPHGLRSSFQDWRAETTSFDRDLGELALAHAPSNKVEAAYRRGDMLEKRRPLMAAWGAYCAGDTATVVRLAI
jgi:integrase